MPAFSRLLERISSQWILVSYSTDGIIPLEELAELLSSRGSLSVVTSRYKRYRVSSQRPSSRGHNTEFVLIVRTDVGGRSGEVRRTLRRIGAAAESDG